mgnify:CR=1 FL=1
MEFRVGSFETIVWEWLNNEALITQKVWVQIPSSSNRNTFVSNVSLRFLHQEFDQVSRKSGSTETNNHLEAWVQIQCATKLPLDDPRILCFGGNEK